VCGFVGQSWGNGDVAVLFETVFASCFPQCWAIATARARHHPDKSRVVGRVNSARSQSGTPVCVWRVWFVASRLLSGLFQTSLSLGGWVDNDVGQPGGTREGRVIVMDQFLFMLTLLTKSERIFLLLNPREKKS